MIDPKINLRVSKNTPLHVFVAATALTREGLGFPQYSNDDVVIPALKKIGYDGEFTFEVLNYFRTIPRELIPEALRYAEKTGRYLIEEFERA